MNRSLYFIIFLCHLASRSVVFASQPTFQRNVQLGDGGVVALTVEMGEHPVDAIYRFKMTHGLKSDERSVLQKKVCALTDCTRSKAIVWRKNIIIAGKTIGEFVLLEGEEPVDLVHQFIEKHNLTIRFKQPLLIEVCEIVVCSRQEPVIWTTPVTIDGKQVEIQLLEGEEVADKIFTTLQPYNISLSERQKVMKVAKTDGVAYTREHAHVVSESVVINSKSTKVLNIYDNGMEPVDVIYNFAEKYGIENTGMFQQLLDAILPKVCKKNMLVCSRFTPIIHTHVIVNGKGEPIGNIDILKDEEPADSIHHFAVQHALDNSYRDVLIRDVCKKVNCKRSRPVVFQKAFTDENGEKIGQVDVLEGEEVIDAAVRFLRKIEMPIHGDLEVTVKNYLLQNACNHRVSCTRNVAHVFDEPIRNETGGLLGRLIVREDQEPSDRVYHFCKKVGCKESLLRKIIDEVCDSDLVLCRRKNPAVLSLPLNDPDGNIIGNLEIELNEEPADSVYRFFAIHKLFERDWDLTSVINQVCDIPGVECSRKKAVKFNQNRFFMGKVDVGSLVIWEDVEVIDALYQKRLEYNLTIDDQLQAFSAICKTRGMYCKRTRAMVYELKQITKRDFEKYGNETCSRKYNGWQYLSSFTNSFIGAKLCSIVAQEFVEMVVEHCLFSLFSLTILWFAVFVLVHFSRSKHILHVGHEIAFYIAVFMLISLWQAKFIEPRNEIDILMHIHEGKLPDLQIFEEEEPVDAILLWGKRAAKDQHPIVREKIYWDILEKTCAEIEAVECRRTRAWEYIDMGHITAYGQVHKIDFFNPSVDPKSRMLCGNNLHAENHCVKRSALRVCRRIIPPLANCVEDLTKHMSDQLDAFDENRLDTKDSYTKLGLEMDAPHGELFPRGAAMINARKMNISPYRRVDNGTLSYPRWDKKSTEAFHLMDTHNKVKDAESREWNDKPCTPYFGGALCAKTDKDGNVMIEV